MNRRLRLLIAPSVLLVLLMIFWLVGTPRPSNLGATDGKLAPCPSSPNCVCSQGADAAHAIEPLRFTGDPDAAWARLRAAVAAMPRTKVVTDTGEYLHAECRTLLMGYTDDLECLRVGDVIHVRSASRLGYSDLGVNRARVESLRAAFSGGGT